MVVHEISRKLIDARTKRGVSVYRAAKDMGLAPFVLDTLEGRNPNREPSPQKCRFVTVMKIMRYYWPMLQPEDFAPGTAMTVCNHCNGTGIIVPGREEEEK